MADLNTDIRRSRTVWPLIVIGVFIFSAVSAGQTSQPGQASPQTPQSQAPSAQSPPPPAEAQPTSQAPAESQGIESGGYEIRQTIELGGHLAGISGNASLWSTYVNLDSGPRLLEQSLDMHSIAHTGLLFDELHMSSFGYGGDPNDATRLRIEKGGWYNFNGSFRRDKHYWDYNLFANPLNPANSNPSFPVPGSPHSLNLVRRMTDLDLTLLPLSPVRLHLALSHNTNEGPSFSTNHEGTEAIVSQPWRDTTNTHQVGISFRFIPRTNLNYDQFFTHYKSDTTWQLNSFPYVLSNGVPASLGLVFNTPAGQPCAAPISNPSTTPQTLNSTCSLLTGYSKVSPFRTDYPTEQFSFQSNYFRRVDMAGRFSYSGANSDMPFYKEVFSGFTSRNREVSHTQSGPGSARRVNASADYGFTAHISDKLRLVDSFRWADFRIPGGWTAQLVSLFGTSAVSAVNTFPSPSCPAPFTAAGCPQHNTSSGPDVTTLTSANFLGQDSKFNTIEVEYDFTHRLGARLGYRFERRNIMIRALDSSVLTFFPILPNRGACAGQPVVNGVCTTTTIDADSDSTEINGHSALFGFWARPTDALRANFDMELYSGDNTFTRIMPRHMQLYKIRSVYKPATWFNVAGAVNIIEKRNTIADVGNLQHFRTYSLSSSVARSEKWNFDLSYSYDDIFSQINVCFVQTPTPAFTVSCGAPFLSALSFYKDTSHMGSANLILRPVPRLTTSFGYTLTSSNGSTLILNPLAPPGPLSFNYHMPAASLAIDLSRHLTWKTGWNYWDYNEKSAPGPTLPRDFRGNVFTLSMRYVM